MLKKKKILFIVNPISGAHNKIAIIKAIPKLLDTDKFDISITHSKKEGDAAQLAKKAVENKMNIVVAVGGDGTINEIASQLVRTKTALAIVPCGSGNGLARELKIPLHYKNAIKLINQLKIKKIDVGVCNNQYFFNLAGAGFDAKVAYDFNRGKKRRFIGYVKALLKEYFTLTNHFFVIKLDHETILDTYFFVTVANGSQWGYNVKAAPNAVLNDKMFSVNLCKKPSLFDIIPFGIKMLLGRINRSKYVTLKNSKKILLNSGIDFFYHIDGDAKGTTQDLEISILHEALKIIHS
jgi:YegS/Rv2252/BmrU family lipid kinase